VRNSLYVVVLLDVNCEADEFSQISVTQRQHCAGGDVSVQLIDRLPSVSSLSHINDLVSVTGQ